MIFQEVFFLYVSGFGPCAALILVAETKVGNITDTVFTKERTRQNKPLIVLRDLSIDEGGFWKEYEVNRNYQV